MKEKHFEWLLDSCEARRGAKLEKGKIYEVKNYPEDVVATWVKTKAAKYVKDKPNEEDKE